MKNKLPQFNDEEYIKNQEAYNNWIQKMKDYLKELEPTNEVVKQELDKFRDREDQESFDERIRNTINEIQIKQTES